MNLPSENDKEFYRRFSSVAKPSTPTINLDDVLIKTFDTCSRAGPETPIALQKPRYRRRTARKKSYTKRSYTKRSYGKTRRTKNARAARQSTIASRDSQSNQDIQVQLSQHSSNLLHSLSSVKRNKIWQELYSEDQWKVVLSDMRTLKPSANSPVSNHQSKLPQLSDNSDMTIPITLNNNDLIASPAQTTEDNYVEVDTGVDLMFFHDDEDLIDDETNEPLNPSNVVQDGDQQVGCNILYPLDTTISNNETVPELNVNPLTVPAAPAVAAETPGSLSPSFEVPIDLSTVSPGDLSNENVVIAASVLKALFDQSLFTEFDRLYRARKENDRQQECLTQELQYLDQRIAARKAEVAAEILPLESRRKAIKQTLRQLRAPYVRRSDRPTKSP